MVRWHDDTEPSDRFDVWSFSQFTERLKVHEARTLAELQSGVMRHATELPRSAEENRRSMRSQARRAPAVV